MPNFMLRLTDDELAAIKAAVEQDGAYSIQSWILQQLSRGVQRAGMDTNNMTSPPGHSFLTVKQLAQQRGVTRHRINYIIAKQAIEPSAIIGGLAYYDPELFD